MIARSWEVCKPQQEGGGRELEGCGMCVCVAQQHTQHTVCAASPARQFTTVQLTYQQSVVPCQPGTSQSTYLCHDHSVVLDLTGSPWNDSFLHT